MEIEIVDVRKLPAPDPKRIGQSDTFVSFRKDGRAIDTLIIPIDTNDIKVIETAIAKELTSRAKAIGHKFNLP